jgi:hypothetical protein
MTNLPSVAPHVRRGLASFGACVAIVLGVASALAPASALAELQVGGSREAVSIDAQNTSIKEILDALGKTFDVHFRSSANLEKQITGTYAGSLPRVLMRVLEGYNVILKTSNDRIEVTVLGTRNAPATAGASPALTVANAAPNVPASPVPASKPINAAEQPALVTPATQPSLVGKDIEPPVAAPSSTASFPLIMLAEGPTPPAPLAPSPGSAPNAFPQGQPSTVAPPTPAVGSAPSAFPVGRPTANLPEVPGSATANAPAAPTPAVKPPAAAGATTPPVAGSPTPTR